MATLRIYDDNQENQRVVEPRRKDNLIAAQSQQPLQQKKRIVLGVLHNNNCNKNGKILDLAKDEKHPKTKAFVPAQYEAFTVYDDNNKKEESVSTFQIYEDHLEKETTHAIRESTELVDVKNRETITLKEEIVTKELLTIKSSEFVLQEDIENEQVRAKKDAEKEQPLAEVPMSLEKSFSYADDERKSLALKREASRALRSNFYDVDEYRADIYNYLRFAETLHRPKPGYMKKQPDITYSMRAILVDWLVEVAEEYRLHSETLYLAVSFIDRFLSYMSVVRAKLQLVGTAAMFIAAKYEEIYPPDVAEFVYITDDTYTKKQVLRMEHLILRVLSFDLTVPTPLAFLTDYCTSNNLSDKIQYLAQYLCELSLLEADPYLQFLPSHLAASAVALARYTLQEEMWPHELELSTGFSLKDLTGCITCLNRTFHNAQSIQQQAVQEKYKSNKYGHVSLLLPRTLNVLSDEDSESA